MALSYLLYSMAKRVKREREGEREGAKNEKHTANVFKIEEEEKDKEKG